MSALEQAFAKNPFGWPAWRWRAALSAVMLLLAVGAFHNLTAIARHAGILAANARLSDQVLGFSTSGVPGGADWFVVTQVRPRSPAAIAGLRAGDRARLVDAPLVSAGALSVPPGALIPFSVVRGSAHFKAALRTPGSDAESRSVSSKLEPILLALVALGGLVSMGFGVALLIRGRHNRAAMLLGVILIGLGAQNAFETAWGPTWDIASLLLLLRIPAFSVETWLWPVFCLEIANAGQEHRTRQLVNRIAFLFAVLQFIPTLTIELSAGVRFFYALVPPPLVVPLFQASIAAPILASHVLGIAIVVRNYRKNDAITRNRLRIIVPAFVFYMIALQFELFWSNGGAGHPELWLAGFVLMSATGPAFLAYSVLHQRLFDLNFAINRTLVYGAVSFILLAAFGLAEWASDRVLPDSWHQGSMLFSAGVAVALFLSFHRLRDWIEHRIESVFFARWQQAEAELKRFVASAGHFEQAPALCRGFEAALAKFAGSEAAVYLRGSDGAYRLQCGGCAAAPAEFADDDPAFALMRAERAPLDLTRLDGTLPGALALPMLDQATLTGFVLLGAKPDGAPYRPDEVDNLGWAAHQVGLDLQALHARELEAEVTLLREKVSWLSAPKPRRTRAKPPLLALTGGAVS